ncbi:MAG: hypothetical protein HRU20_21400 [Pseudomonadales bacterium]|nr:hypothetical protein [Pseudomonadales bacterium]
MLNIKINETQSLLIIAFLLVLAIWSALGIVFTPESAIDDAYITLQNAQLLVGDKSSYIFDQESALVGSTSIVHTIFIAAMIKLGAPAEMAMALSGFINAVLYMCGCALLIARQAIVYRDKLIFLFLSFGLAFAPAQLTNGLETGLAMAVVVFSIYAYESGGKLKRFLLPLLMGIMPLVRPELIALSGLLFLLLSYENFKQSHRLSQSLFNALLIGCLSLLALLPFLTILYLDSGSFLPNTVSAKKYFFAEGCQPFLQRSWTLLQSSPVFIVSFAASLFFLPHLTKQLFGRVLFSFVVVFIIAYWLNMPGAIEHYGARYCYILFPIIIYAGLLYCIKKKQQSKKPLLLYLVFVQTLFIGLPINALQYHTRLNSMATNFKPVVEWVVNHTPEGATIMVHDVGYMAYLIENRKIIDLVGLKTQAVAAFHKKTTWSSCGKDRAVAVRNVVQAYNPQYMVIHDTWDIVYQLTYLIPEITVMEEVFRTQKLDHGFKVYRLKRINPEGEIKKIPHH